VTLDGTEGGYELGTTGGCDGYVFEADDGRVDVDASVVDGAAGWLFGAG